MTDDRIGRWLRETRLRQVMPGTRRPWSQDYLLEQMRADGWAPHRPNYSKYETSKSHPEPDTLDKFLAFWAARGEPGPAPEPVGTTETPDPTAALIAAMTGALLAQTTALIDLRAELADVRATMSTAREAALGERQAMTDMLVDLAARLDALQGRAGIATEAADQGSGHR